MTLHVKTPASIFDMAEHGGATTQFQWAVLREMWSSGHTWLVSVEGKPCVLCGLYPMPDGGHEAWFNALPGAGAHVLALSRGIRLTLSAGQYGEVTTICRTKAGARLARAAGFVRLGVVTDNPNLEVWRWARRSAICSVVATRAPR